MSTHSPEILAYVTGNENIVKTGNPLTFVIADEKEREDIVVDIAKALKANVLLLKNGDYVIISGG